MRRLGARNILLEGVEGREDALHPCCGWQRVHQDTSRTSLQGFLPLLPCFVTSDVPSLPDRSAFATPTSRLH